MKKAVNIKEAKTHLSRLVVRVEAGEEIVIVKAGRPAARLVPFVRAGNAVRMGGLKIEGRIPDDFDTLFAGEIEVLFSVPTAARRKAR